MLTIPPRRAPMFPRRTALPKDWPSEDWASMKVVTMRPMPNTAPRFTRVVTCHFRKYFRNSLSVPRGMIAGLSDR
jgi:hypothetical protein